MFRPWLPTCITQPITTSSISAGSRSLRSTRDLSTSPARSAGCHPESFPLRLPPAVRTASTMTAVGMGWLLGDHLTGRSSLAGGPRDRNLGRFDLDGRSEEHTSELQSRLHLVCRLLLEKKKNKNQ